MKVTSISPRHPDPNEFIVTEYKRDLDSANYFFALILSTIVIACGFFVVTITIHMIIDGWSPAPYWDQWDNIVSGQTVTWSWLVRQQNEHRILIPKLIFVLDRWLAQETNAFDFVVNVFIQATLATLLAWLALKDAKPSLPRRAWVAGLCFTLLFWAGQYENFLWGFQVQFFGVVLLAAAAFATLALGPVTVLGAIATVILSGAALYTLSSGVLVPVLALLLGLWLKRPRWYLLVLLMSAVGWPIVYLRGYKTPEAHSHPIDFFSHPVAVLNHFLVQLGSPFVHAMEVQSDVATSEVAGGVVLAAFLGALIVVLLKPLTPQQKTLTALSIFLVGWAMLTALGRVRFGTDQALASRYLTPLVTLWLSIILLLFSATASRPGLRLLTLTIGTLIAAAAAGSEPRLVDVGLDFAMGRKLATPALLAGVNDPSLTKLLPRPDIVLKERVNLLRFQTSVFAQEWARLMGEKFLDHFALEKDSQCSESFIRVQAIDVAATSWSVVGTAWRSGSLEPMRRIVMVGDDGRIVGYGIGGFDARSIGESPEPDAPATRNWWIGDLQSGNPTKVRAYAVDDKAGACLIGVLPTPAQPAVALASLPVPPPERDGHIDWVAADETALKIVGWGYLSSGAGRVLIDTDLPVASMSILRTPRPDVVRAIHDKSLANSGVEVKFFGGRDVFAGGRHRLCVWTDDPKYGRRLLHEATSTDLSAVFVCEPQAAKAGANPQLQRHADSPAN